MSRLPFILSLLITSAVLSTPPSVRASIITYDIAATINGGDFGGQAFQAFFSYDTGGNSSSQLSPAGVVTPVAVAFTDEDAEINVAEVGGGGSLLQVEASDTYDNLSSYSLAPVAGTFVFQGSFAGAVGLNQPLPTGPGGTVTALSYTVMFTSGPLSGAGFTGISVAPSSSVVPEPSSLLLLVSGSLTVLGVCWWRQRRERLTPVRLQRATT